MVLLDLICVKTCITKNMILEKDLYFEPVCDTHDKSKVN